MTVFGWDATYSGTTPTPEELSVFLGWGVPDAELRAQMQHHLDFATAAVGLYIGRHNLPPDGVSPFAPGIRQCILSLAARSVSNPTSAEYLSAGNVQSKPGQAEFTLAERMILDQYRVTAG